MQSPITSQARRAPRHAAQLSCEILPESGGEQLFGTITDLSLTGARVTADHVLPARTKVLVCFQPIGVAEDLLLAAEVVHLGVRAEGDALFGLAFAELDAELASLLEASLAHLPPRIPRLEDEVVEILDLEEEAASGDVHLLVDAIIVDEAEAQNDGDVFVSLRDSEIEIIRIAS